MSDYSFVACDMKQIVIHGAFSFFSFYSVSFVVISQHGVLLTGATY